MATDINAVKQFIHDHIFEVKTLKEVAAKLSLCPETLRKDFLRKERIQISLFLLTERINKMKQMLEESSLRCFEICAQFGIREDSGGTTFKRVVGISMEAYRELAAPYKRMISLGATGGSIDDQPLQIEIRRRGNGNGNHVPKKNGSNGHATR